MKLKLQDLGLDLRLASFDLGLDSGIEGKDLTLVTCKTTTWSHLGSIMNLLKKKKFQQWKSAASSASHHTYCRVMLPSAGQRITKSRKMMSTPHRVCPYCSLPCRWVGVHFWIRVNSVVFLFLSKRAHFRGEHFPGGCPGGRLGRKKMKDHLMRYSTIVPGHRHPQINTTVLATLCFWQTLGSVTGQHVLT